MERSRGYYAGRRAERYNQVWRAFTARTLEETLALVDVAALGATRARLGRAPRALDVACGTGVLLRRLLERAPDLELVGVDASADMLAQAREALSAAPHKRLIQATVGPGPTANLPLEPQQFDLITFTNALHYLRTPAPALAGLRRLLAPGGQLVVEDYAPHRPAPLWALFEAAIRLVDRQHVRAYSLAEARAFFAEADVTVGAERVFRVDTLWHGWALRGASA